MLDDTYNEADVLSSLKMEMESDVGLDKQGPAANTLGSSFANVYSGLAGLPPPRPSAHPARLPLCVHCYPSVIPRSCAPCTIRLLTALLHVNVLYTRVNSTAVHLFCTSVHRPFLGSFTNLAGSFGNLGDSISGLFKW